ncbi:hypothetical protein CY34DRAFT_213553 [Suillus luteus UH-Slu-Lm8-n1]|uniref:DUF6533 domain-containing protein n=1 Tax=Suillus luteus UH-Slu-Lm8-n1 TaxID=930992 RepID=A0A0D0AHL9_9AGAM|nr:hypothetical protein CY34DRAFT_213553 [Suillus luteus UH-Slu-Lm8-n1]
MQMEYSADSVVAARSLQTYMYIYTLTATFWTYDYASSLDQELMFLLQSRWTKVKVLYIVTRYMPFLLFVGHLYLNFIPNENPNKCLTLSNICRCFKLILVICSECFFILRTYVLWNRSKVVLGAMLSAFFAVVVAFGSILFSAKTIALYETSPIPGITGCYQSSGSVELFLPFVLLFALEFGLLSLTLTRVVHSWRSTNNCLFVVLVKHNIFYYACGLLFSAANILISLLLHDAYNSMFEEYAPSKPAAHSH